MRLDVILTENNYFSSRNKASESIKRGEVFVNGTVVYKGSKEINVDKDIIEIKQVEKPFVSLGGNKLNLAIKYFKPIVKDRVFIDVGASTGGFTDCLLRNDAKKVFCVDVGENLLDKRIANDERVVVMDKTNARFLTKERFSEKIDGIVVDCSFISLEYVLPPLVELLEEDSYVLALIKPQFELQERVRLKNGILRDNAERKKIIKRIYDFIIDLSLVPTGIICVTNNAKKNLEYVIQIKRHGTVLPFEKFIKTIE